MDRDPKIPDKIGVIISTFNQPEWLKKVLWGYACQSRPADEIIVADDGSSPETREMLEWAKNEFNLPIKHVWHDDGGFRKNTIVNAAVLESKSEYLIFTDQDCIPRYDFVETHLKKARKGRFLSGGYFKLPMDLSLRLIREDIQTQRSFSLNWLFKNGIKWHFKCTKLIRAKWFSWFMNHFTTAKATWNGCNSSGWKKDILRINGFNEALRYGGEDRELGERLNNLSIHGIQIRYSAICLHLDHERPYKEEETIRANKTYRKGIRKTHLTRTPEGLYKNQKDYYKLPKKIAFINPSGKLEPEIVKLASFLDESGDEVQIKFGSISCRTLTKISPDVVFICNTGKKSYKERCLKLAHIPDFKVLTLKEFTIRNMNEEVVALIDLSDIPASGIALKTYIHS